MVEIIKTDFRTMSSKRNLSKSKIVAYRQCPKRLWLEAHRPELREDAGSEAVFKRGKQLGELAQTLYNDGSAELIDVNALGFEKAFERSAELLKENKMIFEAGLQAGGALAFADVMKPISKKGKSKWKMIEVKSSTSVKDYPRDDVALQCYVAKEMGVDVKEVALAHVNSAFVYEGAGNYKGLLQEEDLTQEALERYSEAKQWVDEAQQVCALEVEPDITIGNHCANPFPCGFYAYCSAGLEEVDHPATWLPDLRSKSVKALVEEDGSLEMEAIPDSMLNERQLRVKHCTLNNETYFDAEGAKAGLGIQTYPAYFLDFETASLTIPIWVGTRPYQQVPFQFSLHVLNAQHELSHVAFLDISGANPCRDFASALIAHCGSEGPIYVYNRAFEARIVRDLAKLFPEDEAALLALIDRFVDLLPIARNHFYHPSQHGSWSIKAVLPAVGGPDYAALEGIQDGGAAAEAFTYALSDDCPAEEKQLIKNQLLLYCELDTEAMIWVWEKFAGEKIDKTVNQRISLVNDA